MVVIFGVPESTF